jgi:omega-amidase
MKAGFLQWDLAWENPALNREYISWFLSHNSVPDLLILPEMFSTGFSMNAAEQAESMSGHTVQFLKENAATYNTVIAGSLIIAENNSYFNRFIFAYPDGRIMHYDKHHLFTLSTEDKTYTSGKLIPQLSILDWKVCPQICYDLRFPEWVRSALPFDLLIYTASWPQKRSEAWSALLKARAIENQCYVIGVNRIGQDGNGLVYNGQSTIIQFDGEVLLQAGSNEGYFEIIIDKSAQNEYRKSLPFLNDKDLITIG